MAITRLKRKIINNIKKYGIEKPKYVIIPRKYARKMAKANMERAGMKHINRNFSHNWRNYVIVRNR